MSRLADCTPPAGCQSVTVCLGRRLREIRRDWRREVTERQTKRDHSLLNVGRSVYGHIGNISASIVVFTLTPTSTEYTNEYSAG